MSDKKLTIAEQLAAQGYIVKPCKGCHKPMVWAMKETGTWLPLDPVAPVYSIAPAKDREGRVRPYAVRNMLSFVLHHVTCPNREQFSGGQR
jgi:hypothetical protein